MRRTSILALAATLLLVIDIGAIATWPHQSAGSKPTALPSQTATPVQPTSPPPRLPQPGRLLYRMQSINPLGPPRTMSASLTGRSRREPDRPFWPLNQVAPGAGSGSRTLYDHRAHWKSGIELVHQHGKRVLLPFGTLSSPAWSPDYSKIAYLDIQVGPRGQYEGLGLMDPVGRDLGTLVGSGVNDQVDAFAWAPDGRSLAVARRVGRMHRPQVDLVGLDGRKRFLANGYYSALAFSPDGRNLIGLKGLVLDTDLFLLPVKPGGRTRQVTHYAEMVRRKPIRICDHPDSSTGWGPRGDLFWSKDGRWVASTDFISRRTGTGYGTDLVAVDVRSGRRVIMASTPHLTCKELMAYPPPSTSLVPLGWI